jgi:hypothetical protein
MIFKYKMVYKRADDAQVMTTGDVTMRLGDQAAATAVGFLVLGIFCEQ